MKLIQLFELQEKLDLHIEKEHPRQEGENRLAKKILALFVEMGELANELPEIFKFWSNKENNYEKALKEYVDVFHFYLSIGIELGFQDCDLWQPDAEKTIVNQFHETIKSVNELYFLHRVGGIDQISYEFSLGSFLTLGGMLGFSWEQIEASYIEKNAVNHTRQANGY